jgi:hypothetical protein
MQSETYDEDDHLAYDRVGMYSFKRNASMKPPILFARKLTTWMPQGFW